MAGVSLALAGVFLLQYGVKQGLLTPAMRVLAALTLALALALAVMVLATAVIDRRFDLPLLLLSAARGCLARATGP